MDAKDVNAAMEQKLDADLTLLTQLVAIASEHKEVKAKVAFFECIAPCLSPAKVAEFMKVAQPKTARPFDRW